MSRRSLSCFVTFLAVSTAIGIAANGGEARSTAPEPRVAHGLVYDEALRMVVLYGGRNAARQHLGDLWGWNGDRWTRLDAGEAGPAPRSRMALAFDPVLQRLVLHGGGTFAADYDDTWTWSEGRWTRVDGAGPGARSHHQMAFDPASRALVLYGGGRTPAGAPNNDTWLFDARGWVRTLQTLSPARILPGMATGRDGVFLFGGGGFAPGKVTRFADFYEWKHRRWTALPSGPPASMYAALSWHRGARHLVLFGGDSDAGLEGDTWIWNGAWRRLSLPAAPPARSEHAMAYDAARDRIVLVGGRTATGMTNDVWEWDGRAWSQRLPR